MLREGGFKRLDSKLASFFEDERLQRLFSFHSLQAGLAPHDALAMFALRTYMDSIGGVFTAPGGMHAVAAALARAIADAGATIRYDTPVTRILRGGDNAVTGVEIGGSVRLAADAVVCNTDLPVAYRTLLGGVDAPRVARRGKYAPSCVLWVAGVRGEPPGDATMHNLHFGDQWQDAFKAVIKRGVRMSDPSMLVTMQSVGRSAGRTGGLRDGARARAGAEPRRQGQLGARRRATRRRPQAPRRSTRVPDRCRRRTQLRSARLGGDGARARHAVVVEPHGAPVRTVPAAQRRPRACRG